MTEVDFSDVTFACEGEKVMAPKEIFDYSEVKKEIEDTVCDNSDHFENNYSAMIFDLKMYSFSAMKSDDIQVRVEYETVSLDEENGHFKKKIRPKFIFK